MSNIKIYETIILTSDLPVWIQRELATRLRKNFNNFKIKYINKILHSSHITKDLGIKGFWNHDFINKNVLDPRWDSECIVEKSLQLIELGNINSVLEMGIGSGAILLSIMKEYPLIHGTGTDIQWNALCVAMRNGRRNNIKNITYRQGSWWQFNGCTSYDLVICNPPYLDMNESMTTMEATGDPWTALYGGYEGLQPYHIILQGHKYIKKYLILEICYRRKEQILILFKTYGWILLEEIKDINNKVRGLLCTPTKQ